MNSNQVLFIGPDDRDWAVISDSSVQAGFHVTRTVDGNEALSLLSRCEYDVSIIDIHLSSGGNPFETCRFIHDIVRIPVLLVTSLENDQDILDGLEAGADDFVMRPIRPNELVARLRTILKRTTSPLTLPGWILQSGNLLLDLRSHCVIRNGKSTPLSRTELHLLRYLMLHPGTTIRKADLLANVWNYQNFSGDFNLVDSAIKRLRHAIEDDPKHPRYIQTVWGEGYQFCG